MCTLLASPRCYCNIECWESEQPLSVALPIKVISLNKESLPDGPPHFCTNANRWEIPASEITLLLLSPTSQLRLTPPQLYRFTCSNTQCPRSPRRTQALYGGIHSLSTTSDGRDPKRTSYREISKDMQAYYHYHHFVNTADMHKGSIAS